MSDEISIEVISLGDDGGKDVHDFLKKHGKDALKQLLDNSALVSPAIVESGGATDGVTAGCTDDAGEFSILEGAQKVQLALDFVKNLAIVTLPFPTKVKGKGNRKSDDVEDTYWIITSNRQMKLLTDSLLSGMNLYRRGPCLVETSRWDYSHIKAWLKGDSVSDPAALYHRVGDELRKYLDYRDKRFYVVVSLWIIGTYVFPLFNSYPILILTGVSGSGKSKTIKIIEMIAFNAINSANISDASIFRLVEGIRGTILIDESERINDPQQLGQLSLLLSSFSKQGSAIRTQQNKDGAYVPAFFRLFSPKVVANISGINSDALINRSICIHTTPTQDAKANIYPDETAPVWPEIRNEFYKFLMEHWVGVRDAALRVNRDDLGLRGYDFMVWHPILTLAQYFAPFTKLPLLESVVGLIKEETQKRQRERHMDNRSYVLLETIKYMVAHRIGVEETREDGAEFYPTVEIHRVYAEQLEIGLSGPEFDRLSKDYVGKQVAKLDVGEKGMVRIDGEKPARGYWIKMDRINDTLQRFGMEPIPMDKPRPAARSTLEIEIPYASLNNL